MKSDDRVVNGDAEVMRSDGRVIGDEMKNRLRHFSSSDVFWTVLDCVLDFGSSRMVLDVSDVLESMFETILD